LGRAIIALILKFPELAHFRDDNFDIKDVQFFNEEMASLKDSVIALIEDEHEMVTENILKALEISAASSDLNDLKNVLASIQSLTLELAQTKLSTLLLKDLLLQVDQQYKEALSKILLSAGTKSVPADGANSPHSGLGHGVALFKESRVAVRKVFQFLAREFLSEHPFDGLHVG
jgi:hypothetical protein